MPLHYGGVLQFGCRPRSSRTCLEYLAVRTQKVVSTRAIQKKQYGAFRACRTACNTFFASCCSHPTVFARSPGYIHIRPSHYSSAGISRVGPDRKYHSQSRNDAGINWIQLPGPGLMGRWRRSNFATAETNRGLFHNELASRKSRARKLQRRDVSWP